MQIFQVTCAIREKTIFPYQHTFWYAQWAMSNFTTEDMGFMHDVNNNGSQMKDQNGKAIIIPASMQEDGKDHTDITVSDEVSAWTRCLYNTSCSTVKSDKQEATTGCDESRRGGDAKGREAARQAMLDELVNAVVHHAFINQSSVLVK